MTIEPLLFITNEDAGAAYEILCVNVHTAELLLTFPQSPVQKKITAHTLFKISSTTTALFLPNTI